MRDESSAALFQPIVIPLENVRACLFYLSAQFQVTSDAGQSVSCGQLQVICRSLAGFAECEVDPLGAHQRMHAVFQRHDAVIAKSVLPAPHGHISVQ